MAVANTQSYEQVISYLQNYVGIVSEQCAALNSAASDCVDNTFGDPNAAKAAAKLSKCTQDIGSALEDINGIIQDLQEELEEILETEKLSEELDD